MSINRSIFFCTCMSGCVLSYKKSKKKYAYELQKNAKNASSEHLLTWLVMYRLPKTIEHTQEQPIITQIDRFEWLTSDKTIRCSSKASRLIGNHIRFFTFRADWFERLFICRHIYRHAAGKRLRSRSPVLSIRQSFFSDSIVDNITFVLLELFGFYACFFASFFSSSLQFDAEKYTGDMIISHDHDNLPFCFAFFPNIARFVFLILRFTFAFFRWIIRVGCWLCVCCTIYAKLWFGCGCLAFVRCKRDDDSWSHVISR